MLVSPSSFTELIFALSRYFHVVLDLLSIRFYFVSLLLFFPLMNI